MTEADFIKLVEGVNDTNDPITDFTWADGTTSAITYHEDENDNAFAEVEFTLPEEVMVSFSDSDEAETRTVGDLAAFRIYLTEDEEDEEDDEEDEDPNVTALRKAMGVE